MTYYLPRSKSMKMLFSILQHSKCIPVILHVLKIHFSLKPEALFGANVFFAGELFAQAPVSQYPGSVVEAVTDSSRYFVIRIEDGNGKAHLLNTYYNFCFNVSPPLKSIANCVMVFFPPIIHVSDVLEHTFSVERNDVTLDNESIRYSWRLF